MKRLLGVMVVVIAFAACGGGNDDGKSPNTGSTPNTSSNGGTGGTTSGGKMQTQTKKGSNKEPAPVNVPASAQMGSSEFEQALDELCQAVVDWVVVNDVACGVDSGLPDTVVCQATSLSDLFTYSDCVDELEAITCDDWIVEDENGQIPSCYALTDSNLIVAQ